MPETFSEEQIKAKAAEMLDQNPASFKHPSILPGEMCVGEFIAEDGPQIAVERLKAAGRHARLGRPAKFEFASPGQVALIVNTREQSIDELTRDKAKSAS